VRVWEVLLVVGCGARDWRGGIGMVGVRVLLVDDDDVRGGREWAGWSMLLVGK
jgi:hypothetical protein